MSLGQRMKADLAASLLHNPEILFLDEPTIGIDVLSKERIRNFILQVNKERKTTVILTTHDLADIELLSKRIVMIDKGNKVFDGKIADLKSKYGQMRELVFILENIRDLETLEYKSHFNFKDDDLSVTNDGISVKVRFNSSVAPVADMLSYTLSKISVKDISVKDADIEEIIRKLYEQGVE